MVTANGTQVGAQPPAAVRVRQDVVYDTTKAQDDKYLKVYFSQVATNLSFTSDEPLKLLAELNEHLNQAKATRGTVFATSFFEAALPAVVTRLVDRKYMEPAWRDAAVAFVREAITVVVASIRDLTHTDKLLQVMTPIVSRTEELYENHRVDAAPEVLASFAPTATPPRQFSTFDPATNEKGSVYYSMMLEAFGESGGFDALVERINNREKRVESSTLLLFVKMMLVILSELCEPFVAKFVPRFAEAIIGHMRSLSPEEKRSQSLEDLADVLSGTAELLARCRCETEYQMVQTYKLELALEYMQLPILTASLSGIEYIAHLLRVAKNDKPENSIFRKSKQQRGNAGANYHSIEVGFQDFISTLDGPDPPAYSSVTTSTTSTATTNVASNAIILHPTANDSVEYGPGLPDDPRYADADNKGKGPAGSVADEIEAAAAASSTVAGPPRVLTLDFLLRWLAERDIVNLILRLEHPEKLKQGAHIIEFVARERGLTQEVLDTIWTAAERVHESLQIKVFDMVADLLAILPTPQIDYLYCKIQALPTDAYNNQVLNFISLFTRRAVRARADRQEEDGHLYGLDTFWALLQRSSRGTGDERVSEAIVNETCGHIQKLLSDAPKHRELFLARCVENLRVGAIVSISLRLLIDIMGSYVSKDLNAAVLKLDESHALVDSIIADIGRCTALEPVAREEAVRQRLSSLEYILTRSELTLKAEQADAMWDGIMQVDLPNLAFEWFEAVQYVAKTDPYVAARDQATKYPAFTPEVVEHLFTKHLTSCPAGRLTPAGMNTYGKFFLAVNARLKKLRRRGEKSFRVRSFDLVGLDMFWQVIVSSKEPKVVNDALVFLRNMYTCVSSKILWDEICAQRVAFTLRCVEFLLEQSKVGNGGDAQSMMRCLWLLTQIVTEDNKHGIAQQYGGETPTVASRGPPRPRTVLSDSYSFELLGLMTIADIRDAVWQLVMIVPTQTILLCDIDLANVGQDERLVFATKYEPTHPLFVYYNLYVVQVIGSLSKTNEEWRARFIAAGGLKYLIGLFTSPYLLKKDAEDYEYGKMAAGYLANIIHDLFNSNALSAADLAHSLNSTFMHGLMDQISGLASPQPVASAPSMIEVIEVVEDTKKKADRIANCHYGTKRTQLRFNVTGTTHYQVAVYCVDYNTNRRVQALTAFLGDDVTVADPPAGQELHPNAVKNQGLDFYNGQWVVWEVHGEGAFNIMIEIVGTEGPNWVISSLMLDRCADTDAPYDVFPKVVKVDAKTQGRWRGTYGSCGGVLLGRIDYTVPHGSPKAPNVPTLGEWTTNNCLRYEWVSTLTDSPRAMQQVPSGDEIDQDSDVDEVPIKLPAAADTNTVSDRTQSSQALLTMLTAAAEGNPALVDAVLGYPTFGVWLLKCLVRTNDAKLRAGMVHVVEHLCRLPLSPRGQSVADTIRGHMLQFLFASPSDRGEVATFTEFFEVLKTLLRDTSMQAFDASGLLARLVEQLRQMPITESDDDPKADTALQGVLSLTAAILVNDEALRKHAASREGYDLLAEVFGKCLFAKPADKNAPPYPKCKAAATRESAFQLLTVLASDGTFSDEMLTHLTMLLDNARLPSEDDFNIDLSAKTEQREIEQRGRYTGLKNQGCTCYMNATLQQFFAVAALRDAVLRVPLKQEEKEEDRQKNTMFQLQLLFAYMQERKSAWVDTIGFCNTVKLNGVIINPRQQEDANEFFNSLVDQLEPHLKGTPEEFMFRDVFGGRYINQVISKDCSHISEREEDFLTVSVKVQSKRNLIEALEFSILGDTLAGENAYNCDGCSKKVDAVRRTCIQHLPNTLAVHLIRFEFSYESFTNVKVYDYFEFPDELDMKPYTKEGLALAEGRQVEPGQVRPDSYYKYHLVGILIHSGSANAGHYYSYIRERNPPPGETPQWFEFNDRRVDPFNPNNIPDACYGGVYQGMSGGQKQHSAYMLFYDRTECYAAREYSSTPIGEAVAEVQSDHAILDKIWNDNVEAARQRHFMQKPTFDFMWATVEQQGSFPPLLEFRDLTAEEEASRGVRTIKFATRVVMDVLVHCVDANDMEARLRSLMRLYEENLPCCKWLMDRMADKKCPWLRNSALLCPDQDVRCAAAELISAALIRVAPHEERLFFTTESDAPKTTTLSFITEVVSQLTQSAYKPQRKTSQLLQVLLDFARIGHEERRYLIVINAVGDLVALYESQRTSFAVNVPANQKPQELPLVELLVLLSTVADNPCHRAYDGQLGVPAASGLLLPPQGINKLFDKRFLMSIAKRREYAELMRRAIVHWCFANRDLSQRVIDAGITALDQWSSTEAEDSCFILLLRGLLEIDDPDHEWRVDRTMTEAVKKLANNVGTPKIRSTFLRFILDASAADPAVATWVETDDLFRRLLEINTVYRRNVRETMLEKFRFLYPRLEAFVMLADPVIGSASNAGGGAGAGGAAAGAGAGGGAAGAGGGAAAPPAAAPAAAALSAVPQRLVRSAEFEDVPKSYGGGAAGGHRPSPLTVDTAVPHEAPRSSSAPTSPRETAPPSYDSLMSHETTGVDSPSGTVERV